MSQNASISRLRWIPVLGVAVALLSGCEMLGIETPGMENARRAADGRAIGAACRHAVRSIEDCHAANPRISRSAIFEGWREMDVYMRENEIEGMPAGTPAAVPVAPVEEVIVAPAAPAAGAAPAPAATAAPPAGQAAATTPPAQPAPQAGTVQLPPRPALTPPAPPASPAPAPPR